MQNQVTYESKDFYLSACLVAAGIPLIKVEKQHSKFSTFIFDTSPDKAELVIKDHWNKKLQLPTRTLIEAINELKTRLYSGA